MISLFEVKDFLESLEGTSYSPDKAALMMFNHIQELQLKLEANQEAYRKQKEHYNGWKGDGTHAGAYATWNVGMYISGPGEDDYLYELIKDHGPVVDSSMTDAVEEYILPMITGEEFGDKLSGMASDMLGYMTSGINWYELCENWIDEVEFDQCPICGETTCPGAQSVSECNDYEECDICGDWECPAVKSGQDSDCPDYEEPTCEICGSSECDGRADPDWCQNKGKEDEVDA